MHIDDQMSCADAVLLGCRTDDKLLGMQHAERNWKPGQSYSAHLRNYKMAAGL